MEIFLVILFLVVVGGYGIYLSDRKGWNATFKRLSTVARANLEAGKPVKAVTAKTEKDEKDKWTAEFEGKSLELDGPKHEIVRTWYAKISGEVRPHFQCKCGFKDWHLYVPDAKRTANRHVSEQNEAEELLARNGGTHAW
jgi:hypothetical protein